MHKILSRFLSKYKVWLMYRRLRKVMVNDKVEIINGSIAITVED